jgi:hypothetical protein
MVGEKRNVILQRDAGRFHNNFSRLPLDLRQLLLKIVLLYAGQEQCQKKVESRLSARP